jgi:hypothetical protein
MVTTPHSRYEPDLVLPPGDTLAEVLDGIAMTQAELAKRTGLSTKHLNQIVNGAAPRVPLARGGGEPSRGGYRLAR